MCLRRVHTKKQSKYKHFLCNRMDGSQTNESDSKKSKLQSTAKAVDVASASEQAATATMYNTQAFGAAAARLGVLGSRNKSQYLKTQRDALGGNVLIGRSCQTGDCTASGE